MNHFKSCETKMKTLKKKYDLNHLITIFTIKSTFKCIIEIAVVLPKVSIANLDGNLLIRV